MNQFIYTPQETTRVKVDLIIPFNGKELKIKEVSLKDYQDHILGITKMIDKRTEE